MRAPPPSLPAKSVRGGTGLLAAQATCPAWAFHQYRLGAAVLPAPTFGLDALARGSLLHAALEAFWRGRGLAELRAMDADTREAEIARVVALALDEHDREAVAPLAPRLRGLEAQRLAELLATWLEVEATRGEFRVLACEDRQRLDIEGLAITVVVDRVDQLADGRLAIIDYKSGRSDRTKTWADARITEPQLPIYAALAFPDRAVAAVALARVTREDPAFLGVAEEARPAARRRRARRAAPPFRRRRLSRLAGAARLLGRTHPRGRARGQGRHRGGGVRGRKGLAVLRGQAAVAPRRAPSADGGGGRMSADTQGRPKAARTAADHGAGIARRTLRLRALRGGEEP